MIKTLKEVFKELSKSNAHLTNGIAVIQQVRLVYAEGGIDILEAFLFIWVASLRYPTPLFWDTEQPLVLVDSSRIVIKFRVSQNQG